MKRDINIDLLNKMVAGIKRREVPNLTLDEANQLDPMYAMLESDDELAALLRNASNGDFGVTL